MNSKFKSIYYSVLLEFTESTIKKLVEKFKKENSNLSEDNIRTYLNSFEKYKSSPKIVKKDPFTYSWEELENVIDSNFSKANIKTKSDNTDEEKKKLKIYEDSNVIVYKANNQQDAIILGNGYSFCISRSMGGNLYSGYRLRHGSTFYFVRLKNKTAKIQDDKFIEPSHLIVIDIQENNKLQWTWADNGKQGHGTSDTTKEKIVNIFPELRKAFLENIFINDSLSEDEKNKLQKFERGDFNSLSYDEKLEYIKSGYTKNIKFLELDKEQRNEYLRNGHELTDEEFKSLNISERNRYIKIIHMLLKDNINYDDAYIFAKLFINNGIEVPETWIDSISEYIDYAYDYAIFLIGIAKKDIPKKIISKISEETGISYKTAINLVISGTPIKNIPKELILGIIGDNSIDSFAYDFAHFLIKDKKKNINDIPLEIINNLSLDQKERLGFKIEYDESEKIHLNKDSILLENIYLGIYK